jgi:hypothetical protein
MRIVLAVGVILVTLIPVILVSVFVMTLVSVIIMIVMIFIISVHMFLKKCVVAGLQLDRAGRLNQFGRIRIGGEGCNPAFKPRRQTGTDPEHQIRVLQRLCFGRAKAVFVGTGALLHDQGRRANTVHDPSNQ